MSNFTLIDTPPSDAPQAAVFSQIERAFGAVPNMFRAIGQSPAALRSMWGSFGALSQGTLGARLGEQIAVHVADLNRCVYCLSAHTLLGRKAGAGEEEMREAQAGRSSDPKTAAILRFAGEIVTRRGQVGTTTFADLRDAGVTEEEIAEIIAHVALNLFTNYTNVALAVPVDFPVVAFHAEAVAG